MQRRHSSPFITGVKARGERWSRNTTINPWGRAIYRPGWRSGKEEDEEDEEEEENSDFSSHHTGFPPRSMSTQQSTRGGAAINKQSTRLGMDEEEKEKFAFFFSSFDAASIAAGTEVEMTVAGDM